MGHNLLLLALVVWVALASVVAFALCVADKRRARAGRGRVPERVLLGLALVGGSPGLVAGMLLVRHKTRKGSFLARLALVLLAQGLAAYFWVAKGAPVL